MPDSRRRTSPAALPLAAGMLGFFMITLDVSAVNVALATMRARDLHAATNGLQWVVDGYTLMFAALLLSAGALSDRIGARRAYAGGVAAFTLASIACGAAPGLGVLTGARFVQGCAAAVMLPSSLALVRQAFDDPARRARGIALWTAAGSSAVAAGPVLGGILVSAWSWRGIFLINVPAGLVALVLLARVAPSPRLPASLDLGGQLTAVLALGGLTYGVIEGSAAGYTAPRVLAAFAVAAGAAAAFALVESRVATPAVPFRLFRSRAALITLATGFAINTAWYGIVFVIGLYAQQVLGAPPRWRPALMFAVPMALGIVLTNMASPRLAARSGPAVPLVAGMLVTVAGLTRAGQGRSVVQTALLMIPFGAVGLSGPTLITILLQRRAHGAGRPGAAWRVQREPPDGLRDGRGSLRRTAQRRIVLFRSGMVASLAISATLLAGRQAAANAMTFKAPLKLAMARSLWLPHHRASLASIRSVTGCPVCATLLMPGVPARLRISVMCRYISARASN